MTSDNNQLREELAVLRKHNDKLKEMVPANNGSPSNSPGTSRALPSRDILRLKEQAAESVRLRDKLNNVREDVSSQEIFVTCCACSCTCMYNMNMVECVY